MDNRLAWADHRIFRHADDRVLFGIEDTSLFALSPEAHATLSRWHKSTCIDPRAVPLQDVEVLQALCDAQILVPATAKKHPLAQPEPGQIPLTTLVLEVAQDCNLRCTYCYAGAGAYGARPTLMDTATARRAVRYLLDHSGATQHQSLILFGGEPLMNLPAIKAAVDEAAAYGGRPGKQVYLSITTNGTLLTPEIVQFLHENRVSVAISLDGPSDLHDHNRPDVQGNGSYAGIVARLGMLLEGTPLPVAARVTLAPDQWHRVVEVFDHLTDLGLHEVGIAPTSPVNEALLPSSGQEAALLEGFGVLAARVGEAAGKGQFVGFSNILDLLARLHTGQSKTLACGAGFGYMAVDARGQFFPCHRLSGVADFRAGDLATGIDTRRIGSSFKALNQGRERGCSRCWARSLCVGGCHYENYLRETQLGLGRGSSCKFIRDWLELGIRTYARLRATDAIAALSHLLDERARG